MGFQTATIVGYGNESHMRPVEMLLLPFPADLASEMFRVSVSEHGFVAVLVPKIAVVAIATSHRPKFSKLRQPRPVAIATSSFVLHAGAQNK